MNYGYAIAECPVILIILANQTTSIMYEFISGPIVERGSTHAVIEAGGVGYYINISLQTYSDIESAMSAKLYTHFIVREDAQTLFGFSTKEERELFRLLIGVSGVGGNTARMILSTYSVKELMNIISSGNAALLKNVKGLGIKTAQKIIVDLSGKMLDVAAVTDSRPVSAQSKDYEETLAALLSLGFQKAATEKILRKIFDENPGLKVEEAVRLALKHM